MASVAGLTLNEAILPLQETFTPKDLTTTKVENTWTTTQGNEYYYKMYLPVCSDPTNKEVLLYVIEQFSDAAHNDRLHLSLGGERYSKFRQVLDGALRLEWQTLSDARANKTIDSFHEDVHALIALHFAPSSREDQLAYMRQIKPFQLDVAACSSRLTVIDKLGRWLPGSWTDADHAMHNLFATEAEKKRCFFGLMPMKYRIKLAESAHRLDDANFTYAQLTQYMCLQEAIERNERGRKRARGETPTSWRGRDSRGRGRGRGRGGRGYYTYQGGRGNYSRSNYGGQGNYASPNPYITGAQGGRIPQQQGLRTPRPYNRGPQHVPRVSHSNSPQRRFVRGRGPGPQLPQFMAEDHCHQGQEAPVAAPAAAATAAVATALQDHYYESGEQYDGGEEQYYGSEDQQGVDDQYYQYEADDQYYDGVQEEEQAEDHFLQDFGC